MNADILQQMSAWAWRTSLEALPLAIVAILLSRWRSLPASWRWCLPALFFLRLAMPQVPEVGWHWWTPEIQQGVAIPLGEVADEISADPAAARSEFSALPAIWLLGCGTVIAWILVSHLRLRKWIAFNASPATDELEGHCNWAAARIGLSRSVPMRVMPGWSTMAVCGWWQPTLLVPEDLTERFSATQIRGMLLHEMAHVRRRDVLWTWLALGLCALHWFNPLAWIALRRFHADRELACDAAALRALNPSAHRDYGEALLLCMESPAMRIAPTLTPFFRRFPELKQRFQAIMKPTSPSPFTRLITAILVPTLAVITFTTARAQRDGDAPKPASPEKPAAERPLRDGEKPNAEKREGEGGRKKMRDGEGGKTRSRDGEGKRTTERDGDQPRTGARDGDKPKTGLRDGERPKGGEREGDAPKAGPRDEEGAKTGPRDGEKPGTASREGEPRKGEGDKPEAR